MGKIVYTAGFIKRMNAHAIDLCITTLGVVLAILLTSTYMSNFILKLIIIITVGYLLIFLVPVLNDGQTIGKKLFKIQPVKMNSEQPLTVLDIHIRESLKYLMFFFSFGVVHFAGFIMASERQDRRTVHDLICKTHVIDLDYQAIHSNRDRATEDDYYNRGRASIR